MSHYSHLNDTKMTKNRLIDALLDLWAGTPADSISVRTLVLQAGTAQAAIHYHFGDMERLYCEASAAALVAGKDWMETRLADISVLANADLPVQLQASLLASTIADWTVGQRRLAMASRYAPGSQWQAAWDNFWGRFSQALGLGEYAATITCFAAGETARHLLVCNSAIDRALLEETTTALVRWLKDRHLTADKIRPRHQAMALAGYDHPPQSDDALADKIEQAASDLLAEKGHAGVTFRAVAARAEVTLGKVIHQYGVKSELLRRALHRLYESEALGGNPGEFVAQRFPPDTMLDYVLAALFAGAQPVLRAYDEIERAIYNGPEYAGLRGVVRSMDDPSGSWALEQMLAGQQPSGSLVAGFSAVIRGIGYQIEHSAMSADRLREQSNRALAPFLG